MSRTKTTPLSEKLERRFKNREHDQRLFFESRNIISDSDYQWLETIFSSSDTKSRDVFDPKATLYQCLQMLLDLLPKDPDAVTVTVDVKILQICIAKIRLAADMFREQPPPDFTNFQEGWMVDMENPTLYTRRQTYCKAAEMAYFDHLHAGIDVASLPLHCEPQCSCVLQQSPVGERGGLPRRVPCAQESLKNAPNMSKTTIVFVSSLNITFVCFSITKTVHI